jgi:anti-sigma B factor antagonist
LLEPKPSPELNMILDANIDSTTPAAPIVKLSGRMTLGMRLREVESRIDEASGEGTTKLILDVSAVEYVDSAGIGLFMILYGKMKTVGGQLHIVAPNQALLDVFKRTCIDSILTIDPDLATALAA